MLWITSTREAKVSLNVGSHKCHIDFTRLTSRAQTCSKRELVRLIEAEQEKLIHEHCGPRYSRVHTHRRGSSYTKELVTGLGTISFMLKKVGEKVGKDEPLAKASYLFGFWNKFCECPIEGFVERISNISGQCYVRGMPKEVSVNAYIPGTITEVISQQGVVVETPAVFIQGIFGIGGETHGELHVVVESPEDVLQVDQIGPECAGKIVVGGALATINVIDMAVEVGAKGVVTGGIQDQDLKDVIGKEIGVAITGHEDVGLTLIITEGFGRMKISEKTYALLKEYDGRLACINGATQIRAGVIRPEIIIPHKGMDWTKLDEEQEISSEGLMLGTPIRIIREPYFGVLGHVVRLPAELQIIYTESKIRVLEAELEDGRRVSVPRANVEMIEWKSE